MRRWPSLDSLRAFEAAARHLSFVQAAEELHVTPSALSHRIKALEEELGFDLFRRLTRKVALTESGEVLAEGMRRGLAEIGAALDSLERRSSNRALTVTTVPSFAGRWLMPRLPAFYAANPGVDVHLTAGTRRVDLRAGEADLAIRFGTGNYAGLFSRHLMDETVFPVAAPSLLSRHGRISTPAEIVRYPLLHDEEAQRGGQDGDWALWFSQLAIEPPALDRGQRFSSAELVLEAAAGGLGVALARRSLVERELRVGELVRLLEAETPCVWSYWLVCTPERAADALIESFAAWLAAEVAAGGAKSGAASTKRRRGRSRRPGA